MLAEDFIAAKRPAWERLTRLLDRAQNGLAELSADELTELGRLYRQATSDLAMARRDFPRHRVSEYLNGLAGRAHGVVYRGRSTRGHELLAFFTTTFPRAFRETWRFTLVAFLMFFLPALVAFIVSYLDTSNALLIFPGIQDAISDIRSGREWWKEINADGRAASASFIMTNNIGVAFRAFVGGIFFGLITLYVLAFNGAFLGSIAGAAQAFGFAPNLWGFVAAHGVIELSVIFFSGGAGLQIGWAILHPGLLTRRAALVVATRRAALLLVGCVPLLVIAGAIEGFISPSDLPLAVKLAVSLLSGVLLYGYLLFSGRSAATAAA
jgi:uncharacterized membrane protein SpoIIM required for sporulation